MNLKTASTVALIAMGLLTLHLALDVLGTFWGLIRGYYAFTSFIRAGFYVLVSVCLTFFFFVFRSKSN